MAVLVLLEFDAVRDQAAVALRRRRGRSRWARCTRWWPELGWPMRPLRPPNWPAWPRFWSPTPPHWIICWPSPSPRCWSPWRRTIPISWPPRPRSGKRSAARRRAARRAADQRHRRGDRRRYLRAPHLCRQRHGHREIVGRARRSSPSAPPASTPLRAEGGSASDRSPSPCGELPGISEFISAELSKSERPELDRRSRGDFRRPRHAERR